MDGLKRTSVLAKFKVAALTSVIVFVYSAFGSGQSALAQDTAWQIEQSFEQAFISGLRERRLYEIAESHCNKQLQRKDLDSVARNHLVIELLKTQVAVASHSRASEQDAEWKRADDSAAFFTTSEKEKDRAILIKVQHGMIPLARATLIRRELEYQSRNDAAAQQKALSLLRLAIDRLRKCLQDISQLKALRLRDKPRGLGPLTVNQLLALELNVRFEMTRCNLNRALFYPENDRINRLDTLSQVLEQLQTLSKRLTESDELWFDVKLREIEANRLLKKYSLVEQQLAKLNRGNWSEYQKQQLLNEQFQMALGRKQVQVVARNIEQAQPDIHFFQPLDISMVQIALEMASSGSDDGERKKWQNFAVAYSEKIKSAHGAYWGRMADHLLVDIAESRALPSNVQILTRLAEQHLRKKEFAKAIAVFDSAYEIAVEQDDDDSAFSIGYRVAVLLQQQKQYDGSADRFRLLANRFAEHASAPAAHLLACWNKAQATREKPEKRAEYESLLKENINNWPESKSVDRARTWLAKLHEHQRASKKAFDVYSGIAIQSPFFEKNAEALCANAIQALSVVDSSKQAETFEQVSSKLDSLIESVEKQPSGGNALQRLQHCRAQLELLHGKRIETAEKIFRQLLDRQDLDESLRRSTQLWLVIALSRQDDRQTDTSSMLDSIEFRGDDANEWLQGLSGVDPEFKSADVASVKLTVANRLLQQSLEKDQATEWKLIRARSWSAMGKSEEAVSELERLVKQQPGVFRFQVELGRVYAKSTQKEAHVSGLRQWRIIARKVKPQTDLWMEAKYEVSRLQHLIGESDQAAKLIDYVKATSADWDQNPWRRRFENLMDEISKGNRIHR